MRFSHVSFLRTGEIANQVICALKHHHMLFSRPWIERFLPSISATLPSTHPEMVTEFLQQLSGNHDLVNLLGGIVTDKDFERQHGMLLQCTYGKRSLSLCVCVCVCVRVCVCACVQESACVCIHTYTHTYIHMYIHTYVPT